VKAIDLPPEDIATKDVAEKYNIFDVKTFAARMLREKLLSYNSPDEL